MNTLLAFALIIGVPIAASKGLFYRGAWAGISVIAFILALPFGMAPTPPDIPGYTTQPAEVKQWTFDALLFLSFASFLAVCFYREVKKEKDQAPPSHKG
jgi:hypothetical protein